LAESPRIVIVFARVPVLGSVKTRLATAIGEAAALKAYRALGARTLDAVRRSTASAVTVAHTPSDRESERAVRAWLGDGVSFEGQAQGDLGARMHAAIASCLARYAVPARVVVVGTDCPWLTGSHLDLAFAALGSNDIVLGPATDGGYYLIGMCAAHGEVFSDIPWSSPHTLTATLERARDAKLTVQLLEPLRDVDDAADWDAWEAEEADSRSDRTISA
jgi:hypothetical protein